MDSIKINPNAMADELRMLYLKEALSFADSIRRLALVLAQKNNDNADGEHWDDGYVSPTVDFTDDLRRFHSLIQGINMVAACLPCFPDELYDAPDEVTLPKEVLLDLNDKIKQLQLLTSYASKRVLEGIERISWADAPDEDEEAQIKQHIAAERKALTGEC